MIYVLVLNKTSCAWSGAERREQGGAQSKGNSLRAFSSVGGLESMQPRFQRCGNDPADEKIYGRGNDQIILTETLKITISTTVSKRFGEIWSVWESQGTGSGVFSAGKT